MRTLVVATVTAAVVALTGGCSGDDPSRGSDDRPGAGATDDTTPRDPETSAPPSPPSGDGTVVDSAACSEVRAGIDAFNAGAYDETVAHFEVAIPLAEAQDDGSVPASQLIEAVRFYAALDAADYPEAARSSPAFAKYKAITLGQCVPAGGAATEAPGAEI